VLPHVDERRLRGEAFWRPCQSRNFVCAPDASFTTQQIMHTRTLLRANALKQLIPRASAQVECSLA
jgi:hypothetical protein